MYKICFASDTVIPNDLDKNNKWINLNIFVKDI